MALNDIKVRTAKTESKNYKLTDSQGLFLLIHTNGSKYWRMRYTFMRKEKTLAIDQYPTISLASARQKRDEAHRLLAKGIDPNAQKKQIKEEDNNPQTFEKVAREWHACNRKWSDSHSHRVLRTLEIELFPVLGNCLVSNLKTKDFLLPLRMIEQSGRLEVASRLQQRITAIMRFAVQSGIIEHNSAQELVGAVSTRKVTHRPALALESIPDLLRRITFFKGRKLTTLAIRLTLLVFIRSSELRFARWSEVDFDKAMWTIPVERQPIEGVKYSSRGAKMKSPHLVPLSRQALDILKQIAEISRKSEFIFVGDHNIHKPMSENTVNKALRVMGYDTKTEVCGHGFRTMACSALIESGQWSRDAVERQMSHQERNSVRAAYIHKAEHLEERRLMLQWWADYLDANCIEHISPYGFKK